MPDISILFDLDPKIGLERINSNNQREVNRLDLEKLDFHEKVREGYNIVYNSNKDRMVKINAEKAKEEVFKDIQNIILEKLNQ